RSRPESNPTEQNRPRCIGCESPAGGAGAADNPAKAQGQGPQAWRLGSWIANQFKPRKEPGHEAVAEMDLGFLPPLAVPAVNVHAGTFGVRAGIQDPVFLDRRHAQIQLDVAQ